MGRVGARADGRLTRLGAPAGVGAGRPGAVRFPRHEHDRGRPMSNKADILARYQQLRQVSMKISHTLASRLGKELMHEGADDLGMLQDGVLVFGSEAEMAI